MYIFLDMDGVLADFVGGAMQAHGLPDPYADKKNWGTFELEKCWGITVKDFWRGLDFRGFWSGLEKTPEADYIVKTACDIAGQENVCLLTSPSENPYCIPEKKAWVQKYFPHLQKQMLFGSAKRFLAGPDRILVDDYDVNVDNFKKANGHAILVPRLWNRRYTDIDETRSRVQTDLMSLDLKFKAYGGMQ